jgi:homopolymeric O-antigen transport system ATP-binding protein
VNSDVRTVISVEALSKRYRLGVIGARTLREDVSRWWARLRRRGDPLVKVEPEESCRASGKEGYIWALRDVTFGVEQGEVLGIIGRNGAGKSTLLKILSRITAPTLGEVKLAGRVASLLEVGTGFHPELTGRENVFLNGAILGMSRAEVARKLDGIVEFSGVEAYVDTPVKRYSSGMYVRLAFAVAAHLEPDILILDEVLAVGDAAFQKKCLGKMGEVASEGRTVLFVSHNMVAVTSLCRRALWLDDGVIVREGAAPSVVADYVAAATRETGVWEERWDDPAAAPGNDVVRLRRVTVVGEGPRGAPLSMEAPFRIEVEFLNRSPGACLHVTLHFYTDQDLVAFTTGSAADVEWRNRPLPGGVFRAVCYVPGRLLNCGRHRLRVLVVRDMSHPILRHESRVRFDVVDLANREAGWLGREPGVVQPALPWKTEYLGSEATVPSSREQERSA